MKDDKIKEIRNEDRAICPYCQQEQEDSWEIDLGPGMEGDGEAQCEHCDKEFYIRRTVDIYYTTKVKEK